MEIISIYLLQTVHLHGIFPFRKNHMEEENIGLIKKQLTYIEIKKYVIIFPLLP